MSDITVSLLSVNYSSEHLFSRKCTAVFFGAVPEPIIRKGRKGVRWSGGLHTCIVHSGRGGKRGLKGLRREKGQKIRFARRDIWETLGGRLRNREEGECEVVEGVEERKERGKNKCGKGTEDGVNFAWNA